MLTITAKPPFKYFTELDGTALVGGKIYVGVAGLDAEANPIPVYWDDAGTILAPQPIRTIAGVPENGGSPSDFFVSSDYSITVRDANDVLVYSKLQLNADEALAATEVRYKTIAELIAATDTPPEGSIVATETEGETYRVAPSAATDQHLINAAGVKFYEAGFNFSTRDVRTATDAAAYNQGQVVLLRGESLLVDSTATGSDSATSDLGVNGLRSLAGSIFSVVDDTAPQLGGVLDTNGNSVLWSRGANVTVAPTVTLPDDGNVVLFTGSGTVSAINDIRNGATYLATFNSGIVLESSPAFRMPGGSDITTQAGDWAILTQLSAGSWRVSNYQKADGRAVVPSRALLHVRDEKASGTSGGAYTANTTVTRDLNTVRTNEISGASLSANQITLPAGTYEIDADVPIFDIHRSRAWLYDATGSIDLVIGQNVYVAQTVAVNCKIRGRFTISQTSDLEIRVRGTETRIQGLGLAVNDSLPEIYTDVMIRSV